MEFRAKLLATLDAVRPVLEVPGVLIVGSEVPNLLQPGAAATLVISQDVDIGVPVTAHGDVKGRLPQLRARGLRPSEEEPSVWEGEGLLEVNFVGMDPTLSEAAQTYVLEDRDLPLLVFGPLGILRAAAPVRVEALVLPVPRPAELLLEKLVTDRSGEKGDRDLLVALGLLLILPETGLEDLRAAYRALSPEQRYLVRSNLTVLSLLEARAGMPDPGPHRERLAALLRRLEIDEGAGP